MSIDCPRCGSDLHVVNAGVHMASMSTVIVGCAACRDEFQVTATLRPAKQNRGRPPGRSILPVDPREFEEVGA